jgi:osmotically inducible protein OsmC
MKAMYTARALAEAGRGGKIVSEDGRLDLALSVPKDMGGDGGPGTNPEQIFAGGYAACFHSAMMHVGGKDHDLTGSSVASEVSIGQREDGPGFGLAVTLTVRAPGVPQAEAEKLVEATHQVCPYSNATRGNVEVTLQVEGAS